MMGVGELYARSQASEVTQHTPAGLLSLLGDGRTVPFLSLLVLSVFVLACAVGRSLRSIAGSLGCQLL